MSRQTLPNFLAQKTLHKNVIILAASRATGKGPDTEWKAYTHVVPGINHKEEAETAYVEADGVQLSQRDARHFFNYEPWASLPYAK